jgi:hypothetical protein
VESIDPFVPGLIWGKGKWPSIQFAEWQHTCNQLYGGRFPVAFDLMAPLYGIAFQYADFKFNKAARMSGGTDILAAYHRDLELGTYLLPFTLYVPPGYGKVGSKNIPNVEETDNPNLIFTACFEGGHEEWRELSLLSIP